MMRSAATDPEGQQVGRWDVYEPVLAVTVEVFDEFAAEAFPAVLLERHDATLRVLRGGHGELPDLLANRAG